MKGNSVEFLFNKSTDKVAIIAPSSKIENNEDVVTKGLEYFKSKGIDAFLIEDSFGQHDIHANIIEKRFKCINEALSDEKVKIIWCFRGGSGASELSYHLNKNYEKGMIKFSNDKFLVGFSDITALHIFFNQKLNLIYVHGSMITDLTKTETNLDMVLDLFTGKELQIKLNPVNLIATEMIQNKEINQQKFAEEI